MGLLRNVLKAHGRVNVEGVMWFWDYAKDEPVKESEMPEGSERWRESERVRWTAVKEKLDAQRQRNAEGF